MKKVLAIILVFVMCFSLAACSSAESKVAAYVEENEDELIESMESAFTASSGMSCDSKIKAKDAGFIIDINVQGLADVPDGTKEILQSTYSSMDSYFEEALEEMQDEIPELEYFTINVCDEDGNVLAVIKAGD